MTTDTAPILIEVHRVYCALTGLSPNYSIWERDIYEYTRAGFTPADMAETLTWLIRENAKLETKYKRSLSLMKLIGDLRNFDSYLQTARAVNRNFKPSTPKQSVLASWRGSGEQETAIAARAVGEVIKGFTKV